MVCQISKATQTALLAQMGIQRIPRKHLADELGIAEFTLRRVLDGDTPVDVSNRTANLVIGWLDKSTAKS